MDFETWMQSVPSQHDVTKLLGDRRTLDTSGQLYRALGSIEANISEGYSRGSGKDRARFYEYALGSAQESRGWYYKGRYVLGEAVAEHRIRLTTHIARLLLRMIPDQRRFGSFGHEATIPYGTEQREADCPTPSHPAETSGLLENALLP